MARSLPWRMLRSGCLAGLVLILPLANGVLANAPSLNGGVAGNQLANPDSPSKANGTSAVPIEKIEPP